MEMTFENPFGVEKKRSYIIAGPCSAETEQRRFERN